MLRRASKASAIVFNTFDSLEQDVLDALSAAVPSAPIYTIGPLDFLVEQKIEFDQLKHIGSNLWKEQTECFQWLDSKEPKSVVYVNYGSITTMTPEQLSEFAWGLANSKKPFLWIIRPDLVSGETAIFPPEFVAETEGRGMFASWCSQQQVLKHPSIGGFLSHMGWNSTIESICSGVPMVCWPFFAEQQTNCYFACKEWGIGMEIDANVKRDEVEKLVNQLMEGEKGMQLRRSVMAWKKKAEEATKPGGSSSQNLDKLFDQLSSSNRQVHMN